MNRIWILIKSKDDDNENNEKNTSKRGKKE